MSAKAGTSSFQRGDLIAGKYRVERVLGQGGMGVVLKARHLGLGEMVAVKLIREERAASVSGSSDALARFRREARAAARIKSEHVARVLDVDRLPEGAPYIVMEFIDGTDLEGLVKERGGPLPAEEVATYILQACEGLAEAHALGMVHRDLKLKNLFLTKRRDGRPLIKVIDFGVVKLTPTGDAPSADDSERTLTLDGREPPALSYDTTTRDQGLTGAATLVGSVHYMAPEQIRASSIVDARADVWSLGVCMYALLTGELPFDGANLLAVFAAIQGRPPRDVRELVPSVPSAMADIVNRTLEKDVRRRFANVAELAHAIAPFTSDPAGAQRVATILASASPPPLLGEDDTEQAVDSTLAHPLARAESTIDAAAASDSIARPLPRPQRSMTTIVGIAITLALGVAVVVTIKHPWSSSSATSQQSSSPLPTPSSSPAPSPSPPPTPPVIAAPAPDPSTSHTARPLTTTTTTGPARKRVGGPNTTPPTKPAASLPTPPPKAEPSNAYDHF